MRGDQDLKLERPPLESGKILPQREKLPIWPGAYWG